MENKSKVKLGILSAIVLLTGFFSYSIYQKLHTNTPDDIKDHTGKYILNPDYYKFKEYEWTDLKSVYPTKLAYDPSWFKLPPDKYIPKEQPIPKNISNISDPIIRRQAYFNFLCKSESAIYKKNINYQNQGILDLTETMLMPKSNVIISNQILQSEANSNPFIFPTYSKVSRVINKTDVYNFYYENITDHPKSNWNADNNSFREVMSFTGDIYQLKYDKLNFEFLPIKKVEKSQAKFYSIQKHIERQSIVNLGIYGVEGIVFDKENNKLVNYYKLFYMGALLPWTTEGAISNFSWAKLQSCGIKANIIEDF